MMRPVPRAVRFETSTPPERIVMSPLHAPLSAVSATTPDHPVFAS